MILLKQIRDRQGIESCSFASQSMYPYLLQLQNQCRRVLHSAFMSLNVGPPTKREIWISIVLLVSLLLFTRVNYTARYQQSYIDAVTHKSKDHVNSVTDTPSSPRNYRTRSFWASGEVPETQILVHVAGKLSFPRCGRTCSEGL